MNAHFCGCAAAEAFEAFVARVCVPVRMIDMTRGVVGSGRKKKGTFAIFGMLFRFRLFLLNHATVRYVAYS